MFSVDGTYLGCALRAGEQQLGGPWRISWLNSTSSLAVVHTKDLCHHISLIQVYSDQNKAIMDGKSAKLEELPGGKSSAGESVILIETDKMGGISPTAVSQMNWKDKLILIANAFDKNPHNTNKNFWYILNGWLHNSAILELLFLFSSVIALTIIFNNQFQLYRPSLLDTNTYRT